METKKKIGVFLCRCGGNISQVLDLDRLKAFAKDQPDVEFAEYQSFTCSSEGQSIIQNAIKEQDIDAVVITAQDQHGKTFAKLTLDGSAPSLEFFDKKGACTGKMGLSETGEPYVERTGVDAVAVAR